MTGLDPFAPRRTGVRLTAALLGLLVVGAIAAIAARGQETNATRPAGTLELVVEFNRFADARDDLSPRGDSVGDRIAYSDPVFDKANRTRLGRAMFVNTFQEGSNVLVAGAIRLRDGTITLAGTLRNGEADIAVTGGTGAYAGWRGTYEQSNTPVELRGDDGPGRYRTTIAFIR